MRPRRFGRGEPSRGQRNGRCPTSFNAATAFRPWRTQGGPTVEAERSGLQCGHGVSAVENVTVASVEVSAAETLQCGHGVSAVENLTVISTLALDLPLQCGHGVSAVENQEVPPAALRAVRPSMRPRRFGRGELLWMVDEILPVKLPSMRPRRFGRGEPGRRRPSAGRCRPSMRPRRFGRGERSSAAAPCPWCCAPFNAATAFRPWRTRPAQERPGRVLRPSMRPRRFGRGEPDFHLRWYSGDVICLQCGHGVSAVENHHRHVAQRSRQPPSMRPRRFGRGELGRDLVGADKVQPSMRPRRFGRGEPPERPGRGTVGPSFNAATAFRPWRTPLFVE